jgi:hypothetical protein
MSPLRPAVPTLAALLACLCACATASPSGPGPTAGPAAAPAAPAAAPAAPAPAPPAADAPDEAPPEGGRTVEDLQLGVRYALPPIEGGWRDNPEGFAAKGVRVGSVALPLGGAATPITCRDTARSRITAMGGHPGDVEVAPEEGGPPASPPPPLRDQAVSDGPVASWSFTRGEGAAAIRNRWAFYGRGADCLILQVASRAGDPAGDAVFELASRTHRLAPLSPDRQRDLELSGGVRLLEQREPAAALDRFEALASREPALARARFFALMAGYELGPQAYARVLGHGEAALASRDLLPEQRQAALRAVGVMQLGLGKVQAAAATLAELVVRAPELAEGQYNYACALARLGDAPGSLEHLAAAIRLDGSLAEHAQADEDLVSLRGKAAFEALVHPPAAKKK